MNIQVFVIFLGILIGTGLGLYENDVSKSYGCYIVRGDPGYDIMHSNGSFYYSILLQGSYTPNLHLAREAKKQCNMDEVEEERSTKHDGEIVE